MTSLTGVPFPNNPDSMPSCPADLTGTWVESNLNAYPVEGTEAHVRELLDIPALFKTQRNVRVYCGEFGVYMPNAGFMDRIRWYDLVRNYLEANEIAWTTWAYCGEFGLFEEGSNELPEYDFSIPLLQALGLTIPDQQEYVMLPDSSGFSIYSDYISNRIIESSYSGTSATDFYEDELPENGNFCIAWSNASQNNTIGFDFKPDKDLSFLAENDFVFNCWLRGNDESIKFDIRFLDTKTSVPEDHPWRMGITIDKTLVDWNGQWQNLKIPLKDFREKGSWDNNAWFNPIGAFDWTATDRLEIVAEHMDLTGIEIYFDEISITKSLATGLNKNKRMSAANNDILSIYPNPASVISTLRYTVISQGLVDISVYNLSGQLLRTIVHDNLLPGSYSLDLNPEEAGRTSAGIYLCRMVTSESIEIVKFISTPY